MSQTTLGKYQLIKKLATGGMAEVWLAKQQGVAGFSKNVVVKRILPHLAEDREFVEMFRHEALIAARFNHPNIAQIFEFDEVGGSYFIAMEFIHGEDLGRVMRKAWSSGQWIARPLAIRIVASACEGLYYAHAKTDDAGRPLKVVHRDISPQNILVSFDGSVKVVDFGIAKAADQASLTKSGAIKGKFAYMSPEQAAGKALDARSDIFAIGLVLYELLTGVRPLKRDNEIATLQAALECAIEKPSDVADVPKDLDSVVMRALAKHADDRYRDARQFQSALEEFLVSQRWVASSVQISELMNTLFADRLSEEAKLGDVSPQDSDPSQSAQRPPPKPDQKRAGPSTSEMNWEAPPGASEPDRGGTRASPRTMSKASYRSSDSSRDSSREPSRTRAPTQAAPDVPAWDAPPGTAELSRRTGESRISEVSRKSVSNETAIARTPSRADLPRQRPATGTNVPRTNGPNAARGAREEDDRDEREDRDEIDDRDRDNETRAQVVRDEEDDRYREDDDERFAPDDDREPPRAEPARRKSLPSVPRTSSKQNVRRASTGVKVPPPAEADEQEPPRKAPPAPKKPKARMSSDKVPAAGKKPEVDPLLDGLVDPEELRARQLKRLKQVLYASLGAAALLLGFIFREDVIRFLNHRESNGQEILVEVNSSLPVRVSVRHNRDEQAKEPVTFLGQGSHLDPKGGAHLRDTIVLDNPEQGVHYEEEIPFGEPGQVKLIEKKFETGHVILEVSPKSLAGADVMMNGQAVGKVGGGKLELYEGKHLLTIDSDQLGKGLSCEVDVKPNATTRQTCNLTKQLASKGGE